MNFDYSTESQKQITFKPLVMMQQLSKTVPANGIYIYMIIRKKNLILFFVSQTINLV